MKTKNMLRVTTLLGLFIPVIASAELNYDAIDIGYSKTSESGSADLNMLNFGISKGISSNVFLQGGYSTGSMASGTSFGDISASGWSVGGGFHTPIKTDVDLIVSANFGQSTASLAGISISGNGHGVGIGIRAAITPQLEGTLGGNYTSFSVNSSTTTSTGISGELGFNVTPQLQLVVGLDSDSNSPQAGASYSTQTVSFGARFFY